MVIELKQTQPIHSLTRVFSLLNSYITSVSLPSFPVGAMTILSPGTQSTGC